MSDSYYCWQCHALLDELILPMSRREECSHCGADQHVCNMCIFFEQKGRGDCSEERAELVSARDRANFCDYFKPSTRIYNAGSTSNQQNAKAKLMALFGDDTSASANAMPKTVPTTPTLSSTEAVDTRLSSAEIARQKLRDLFGD